MYYCRYRLGVNGWEHRPLGAGGVGKLLSTAIIRNAVSPLNSYLDCDALYMEDELRKASGKYRGFCIWTALGGAGRGSGGLGSTRQDLHKKISPTDPRSARMVSL